MHWGGGGCVIVDRRGTDLLPEMKVVDKDPFNLGMSFPKSEARHGAEQGGGGRQKAQRARGGVRHGAERRGRGGGRHKAQRVRGKGRGGVVEQGWEGESGAGRQAWERRGARRSGFVVQQWGLSNRVAGRERVCVGKSWGMQGNSRCSRKIWASMAL